MRLTSEALAPDPTLANPFAGVFSCVDSQPWGWQLTLSIIEILTIDMHAHYPSFPITVEQTSGTCREASSGSDHASSGASGKAFEIAIKAIKKVTPAAGDFNFSSASR